MHIFTFDQIDLNLDQIAAKKFGIEKSYSRFMGILRRKAPSLLKHLILSSVVVEEWVRDQHGGSLEICMLSHILS